MATFWWSFSRFPRLGERWFDLMHLRNPRPVTPTPWPPTLGNRLTEQAPLSGFDFFFFPVLMQFGVELPPFGRGVKRNEQFRSTPFMPILGCLHFVHSRCFDRPHWIQLGGFHWQARGRNLHLLRLILLLIRLAHPSARVRDRWLKLGWSQSHFGRGRSLRVLPDDRQGILGYKGARHCRHTICYSAVWTQLRGVDCLWIV